MNYVRRHPVNRHKNTPIVFWLLIDSYLVSPIQTTINSTLAQHTHSSIFASLISFSVGTIALFILTLVFNRSLKISSTHKTLGKIKSIYFIGGIQEWHS